MAAKKISSKTTSTTKTKEASKTTKKQSKPATQRDAFGNRIGTQAADINAKVTTKPKDVASLAKESGYSAARVRSHMRALLGKKLIVETKEGFKKAPAKRNRKATK